MSRAGKILEILKFLKRKKPSKPKTRADVRSTVKLKTSGPKLRSTTMGMRR